ncbi:MAG: hypothetical protein BWY91_00518 [bacterium ADurb.BinA028]|nr:MAG: hypothetical protein BWY91_00518 [bacterium ADurb.BinA028]
MVRSAPGDNRTRRAGASSCRSRLVIAPRSSVRNRSAGAVTATSKWSSSARNGRSESRLESDTVAMKVMTSRWSPSARNSVSSRSTPSVLAASMFRTMHRVCSRVSRNSASRSVRASELSWLASTEMLRPPGCSAWKSSATKVNFPLPVSPRTIVGMPSAIAERSSAHARTHAGDEP